MTVHFVNYAIDVSDLVTAITGGIIGALAAGIPSYLIAKRQSRELLQRDADARTREEKALALTTTVKFIQIVNSLAGLQQHVESCFAATEGEKMEPWQRLIPMVGHSDEAKIRFNDNEITLLARANQSQLMQDLILLASKNSSVIISWQDYCKRREALAERAPTPTSFEGECGAVLLTEEQVNELKIFTIPLNNLALSFRKYLAEDIELAERIAKSLPAAYSAYFDVENFVTLDFPIDGDLPQERESAKSGN